MKFSACFIAVLLLFGGMNCQQNPQEETLLIAVAANFRAPLESILDAAGISADVVSGASGKLATQIENGAPFHLFFSADTVYPQRLFEKGLGEKPQNYAVGKLAFWTKGGENVKLNSFELRAEAHVAIPNPAIAPYGAAAKKALSRLGKWEMWEPQIIYGESVGQTAFYMKTGAADAGINALSVFRESDWVNQAEYLVLPDSLCDGIAQSYLVLDKGRNLADVKGVIEALRSQKGKEILKNFGYSLP